MEYSEIVIAYLFIVLFVVAVSVTGSFFTTPEIAGWYSGLNLPSITPSGAVIGIVWTVLFILLAASAIVFWRTSKKKDRGMFVWLLVVNGILNVGWSYLFFHLHNIASAFGEIWVLNASIVALIWYLWSRNRTAAYLLIPYFAWVSFATYLTFSILKLNG